MRTSRTVLLASPFLLLLLLAPLAPAARTRLGATVKDYRHGYSIRIPDEWLVARATLEEPLVVGAWHGPRPGTVTPTLTILRIPRMPEFARNAEGELVLPEGMAPKLGPDDPVSVRDWLDRTLEPYGPQGRIEERKDLRIGGEKAALYRATYRARELVQLLVAVVRSPEYEFGVILVSEEAEYRESHEAAFLGAIRNFRILTIRDEKEVDYEEAFSSEKRGAGDEEEERWIAAVKESVRGTEGWDYLATENYLVVFDEAIRPVDVMRVAVHIEAIRRDVYEKLFPADEPVTAVCVVRVCKDLEQYLTQGGIEGSAGLWNPAERELIFFVENQDSIRTLYHEAFHQYIHYAFGEIAPAVWFNEGHGDYFAGFEYRGEFAPGKFRWRTPTIRAAIRDGTTVPLDEFLGYTQAEYYANPGLCYAQGWSLVYFLRHTTNERYRRILPTYFDVMKRELETQRAASGPQGSVFSPARDASLRKAREAAFEGIDLDQLELDWKRFPF